MIDEDEAKRGRGHKRQESAERAAGSELDFLQVCSATARASDRRAGEEMLVDFVPTFIFHALPPPVSPKMNGAPDRPGWHTL